MRRQVLVRDSAGICGGPAVAVHRQGPHNGGRDGGFSAALTHFSRSSRSFGVERQFSEPSMVKSSSPLRAPAQRTSAFCRHGHCDLSQLVSETTTTQVLTQAFPFCVVTCFVRTSCGRLKVLHTPGPQGGEESDGTVHT